MITHNPYGFPKQARNAVNNSNPVEDNFDISDCKYINSCIKCIDKCNKQCPDYTVRKGS